jgi:RNA polymerase sigma-70 factor (ECF subfamily)
MFLAVATERDMSEAPESTRGPEWGRELGLDAGVSSDQQSRFLAENMRRVFLTIHRIVGNVADAQDLTQETFIKALQRQDQLKDLEKAAQWVSRIARNTAIDFLRRSGRISFTELEELPEPALRSRGDSPEQSLLKAEHRERLHAGLEILTQRERTALLLRDVEDLTAEQVAAELSCSKATVRSHIANARVKLRKHFERRRL